MTTRHSVSSRLRRGIGAQAFSQGVQVFVRFAEVPIFLAAWGVQLYGEWLLLAAIPMYLAMADAGFGNAASHEMAMLAGVGDLGRALRVFRSSWVLVTALSVLAAGLVTALALVLPLVDWLGFEVITPETLRVAIPLLALNVVFALQTGLLYGVFWTEGRYGTGMTLLAITRLLEFGGLMAAVVSGGGPTWAAAGFAGGHLAGLIITRIALYRIAPWLRYGWSGASRQELRRLSGPAFATLAFPVGNAFSVQGMRLVVGAVLGPAAVAVFTPIRTLSQLALQPKQVVGLLIEPEMSLAYGKDDAPLFRRLFRGSCRVSLWSSVAMCVLLALAGPALLRVWTQGQVAMVWGLFGPLLIAVLINSLWSTALVVAYSTNRHQRIGLAYALVYGCGGVGLAYLGVRTAGFAGMGAALVAVELVMAGYVLPASVKMCGESGRAWARSVASPPWFPARKP